MSTSKTLVLPQGSRLFGMLLPCPMKLADLHGTKVAKEQQVELLHAFYRGELIFELARKYGLRGTEVEELIRRDGGKTRNRT